MIGHPAKRDRICGDPLGKRMSTRIGIKTLRAIFKSQSLTSFRKSHAPALISLFPIYPVPTGTGTHYFLLIT